MLLKVPTLSALRTLGFILRTSDLEGEVRFQSLYGARLFEPGNPRIHSDYEEITSDYQYRIFFSQITNGTGLGVHESYEI